MKQAILTVIGKDRRGIIAKVTGILYACGCNLEDVSMTLLEGEFAMMMVVSYESAKRGKMESDLKRLYGIWKLTFTWKDITQKLRRGEKHLPGTSSYLVTAMGRDRTGIVYDTSHLMARFGLNITDLNSRILGNERHSIYMMMLEADVPKKVSIRKLERSLAALGKKLKIEVTLKPIERVQL
jgi:glycine cleavage system transcriptional repressor